LTEHKNPVIIHSVDEEISLHQFSSPSPKQMFAQRHPIRHGRQRALEQALESGSKIQNSPAFQNLAVAVDDDAVTTWLG
jgi:hypothetical protein